MDSEVMMKKSARYRHGKRLGGMPVVLIGSAPLSKLLPEHRQITLIPCLSDCTISHSGLYATHLLFVVQAVGKFALLRRFGKFNKERLE